MTARLASAASPKPDDGEVRKVATERVLISSLYARSYYNDDRERC